MTKNPKLLKFGRAIRKLREGKGWSQELLAEHAELHRNYVSSLERGERNVALLNITQLAKALNLKASKLLELADL